VFQAWQVRALIAARYAKKKAEDEETLLFKDNRQLLERGGKPT